MQEPGNQARGSCVCVCVWGGGVGGWEGHKYYMYMLKIGGLNVRREGGGGGDEG